MEKEISVKDMYLKFIELKDFLLSKWILIISISLVFSTLGLTYAFLKPVKYKATLNFVLEEDDSQAGGGLSSLASSFGIGGLGTSSGLFSSSNIVEFIKSRNLIEEALLLPIDEKNQKTFAQKYLEDNEIIENFKKSETKELKSLEFKVDEERSKFSRTKDSVLADIYLRISKEELVVDKLDDETTIFELKLVSRNESFSKNFLIKLVEVTAKNYIFSKTQKAKLNVDLLQKQVDSVKRELFTSMTGAASSSDQVFGLNPAMNIQRVPSTKKQIEVQANQAILMELVKNLEMSKMNLLNQTPLFQVIDKPIFPLEEVKFRKLFGVIIGGILGGFIIVSYLLLIRFISKIKNS